MDIIKNKILAPLTTFKIGGPAENFCDVKTVAELIEAVKLAHQNHWPITVIGNGSNILVADRGITGLVIKNSTSEIKLLPGHQVELASGVFLPKAIFYLLGQGLTGLEWFAGIPATIGGATYINLHGNNKFWSDFLISAQVIDQFDQVLTVDKQYFHFAYDDSALKTNRAVVLSVILQLGAADKDQAVAVAKNWQLAKSHQPQMSAGCIFQNPPGKHLGSIIDRQLHLKGHQIGQAVIAPEHASFIKNLGGATADDVLRLIKLVARTAREKLNLNLKLEIVTLGFTQKEICLS